MRHLAVPGIFLISFFFLFLLLLVSLFCYRAFHLFSTGKCTGRKQQQQQTLRKNSFRHVGKQPNNAASRLAESTIIHVFLLLSSPCENQPAKSGAVLLSYIAAVFCLFLVSIFYRLRLRTSAPTITQPNNISTAILLTRTPASEK